MNFKEWPEFSKECKRLGKKYKSLPSDLEEFCKIVSVAPLGNSKHFVVITKTKSFYIIKARFFCRYLKGSSLRIIYSYHQLESEVEFLELYFKGDKNNENSERIKEYLKNQTVV